MRVAILNHRYYPFRGGSEIYVQRLAEWFAGSRWEVRVVTTNAFDLEYFWDRRFKTVDAPAQETIAGINVERLRVRHPPVAPVLFQGGRRVMGEASRHVKARWPYERFSRALPSIQGLEQSLDYGPSPDIIVGTNLGLEGLAVRGLEMARRIGAHFILLPFAHLGASGDPVARRYVSMPHQRALIQQSDLIVALTELEAEALEEFGAHPGRIVVAGAGVDSYTPSTFHENESVAAEERSFTVVSIGALAFDKGTPDLIRASMLLHERGVDHRLILAGPELSSFGHWFRDSGLDRCDWIELRGVISDKEKHRLLSESDALVLASRTESFGIVYLEAWMHGLPVIAADAGAVREVVADRIDGLLVPFGVPEAIACGLISLKSDPEWASALGGAGYAKVRTRFLWRHVHERIRSGLVNVLGVDVS